MKLNPFYYGPPEMKILYLGGGGREHLCCELGLKIDHFRANYCGV